MFGTKGQSRGLLVRFVVAALVCGVAVLGQAGTASAYLREFEAVRMDGERSSATQQGRSVACPEPKTLIGVGGSLSQEGAFGYEWKNLGLTAVFPGPRGRLPTDVNVRGVETDPYSQDWKVVAAGYCAEKTRLPPSQAPVYPGVSYPTYINSVSYWSSASQLDSADTTPPTKTVATRCPPGRKRIGGGFKVTGAEAAVVSHVSIKSAGFGHVEALESDDSSRPWRLTHYAICASFDYDPNARYVAGDSLTFTEQGSPIGSQPTERAIARCPAGHFPIGGGADVFGPTAVVLTASYPIRTDEGWGWYGRAVEEDLTFANWRLRVRAACVRSIPYS